MAGKEEEEEKLAWDVLEVLHLCPSNTRVGAEEKDAAEGGGDQSWRQGGLANKDHRNSWKNSRANLGQY